jgi:hypothetical protein
VRRTSYTRRKLIMYLVNAVLSLREEALDCALTYSSGQHTASRDDIMTDQWLRTVPFLNLREHRRGNVEGGKARICCRHIGTPVDQSSDDCLRDGDEEDKHARI